jgi:hypothetical protein
MSDYGDIEGAVEHAFDPDRSYSENMARITNYLDQFGSPDDDIASQQRELAVEDEIRRQGGSVIDEALRGYHGR